MIAGSVGQIDCSLAADTVTGLLPKILFQLFREPSLPNAGMPILRNTTKANGQYTDNKSKQSEVYEIAPVEQVQHRLDNEGRAKQN